MKSLWRKQFANSAAKQRPLSWAQLSHQKVRLAVAMGGISFANILIFMQLGFLNLFTGGATELPKKIKGDLFLLNPSTEFLGSNGFARIRLYQAAAIKGVAFTTPIYIGQAFGPILISTNLLKEERLPLTPPKKYLTFPNYINNRNSSLSPTVFYLTDLQSLNLAPFPKQLPRRVQPQQCLIIVGSRLKVYLA
jgi:putative ABC transport system permease protein